MPEPDLLPTPRESLIPTTVAMDRENLEWLDQVAEDAGRSRSDALREILRNVREQQARRAS